MALHKQIMKPYYYEIKTRKSTEIFQVDEHPRLTPLEKLATLKPVFREGGSVTAANSSGRNDGAAALLIMSKEKAEALGLQPKVKIIAQAAAGVDPFIMGIGPVPATRKALKQAGLSSFGFIFWFFGVCGSESLLLLFPCLLSLPK